VTTGEQSVSRADALVAMADYTADTFAGLIGQVFRFEPADATVAGSPALLELIVRRALPELVIRFCCCSSCAATRRSVRACTESCAKVSSLASGF
jgi:hypothetical protein